jgi:hypothetical protein
MGCESRLAVTTWPFDRNLADPYSDGEGSTELEADAEAEAETDAEADAETSIELEGEALSEGIGARDGSGTGVGSGMNRDGMPATDSTMISTKIPSTTRIHGRASRSSRGGSEPR